MAHHAQVRSRRVEPLSSALTRLLKQRGWTAHVDRQRVLLHWAVLVGPLNASHAKALRVDGNVLIVETDSPVWSHTLNMMKLDLIQRLREAVSGTEVRDIRFFCGDENSTRTITERARRGRKAPPRPAR